MGHKAEKVGNARVANGFFGLISMRARARKVVSLAPLVSPCRLLSAGYPAQHSAPVFGVTLEIHAGNGDGTPVRARVALVVPKKSLTGAPVERVDTRVLQVSCSFERPE